MLVLDLDIDTVQKCIRILISNILELKDLLQILIDRKTVKKKEVESLFGELYSKVVMGSKAFI